MKKILITGAGGMLGTDLSKVFKGSFDLLGCGRNPANHLEIPYHRIDLTRSNDTAKIIKSYQPDIIFHCAAMTNVDKCQSDPDEAFRQNSDVTKFLAEAARDNRAFLFFFSTDYVFDGSKQGAYLESDPINPKSFYGESKARAETYIRQTFDDYGIFRISWLYGFHGNSFPRTIFERGKTQKLFEVVEDQIGRPTYTRDIAEAVSELLMKSRDVEILKKIKGQIFHLGNEGEVSRAGLAKFILDKSGYKDAKVQPIFSGDLERAQIRPKNSVLSLEKSHQLLGMKLRLWGSAVEDFVKVLQQTVII